MNTESDLRIHILLTHPEVAVSSQILHDKHYLIFEFRNHFSTRAAEEACEVWTNFHHQNFQGAIHIWDCTRMSGFEMSAKKVWMNKMKVFDSLIERIVLVSDMVLIRGAARLMSKFSKHQLDVYRSLDQMREQEGLFDLEQ